VVPTVVFDFNETLLDAGALDEHFEAAFGAGRVRLEWFNELISRALVCNALGEYRPFPQVAAEALDAVAIRYGKTAFSQRDTILKQLAFLPLHADVPAALAYLRDAGVRIALLTNSPQAQADEALRRFGVRELFIAVLSVETVRRFKPDRAVYEMAAAALHEVPSRMWLVSAHWWDCAGAARLGWKTALVRRPGAHNDGRTVHPLIEAPDALDAIHKIVPITESRAL
jgi:2-haloacid dehalogenase